MKVERSLSGWETSHIATYVSGMPLTLTSSNCASLTGEGNVHARY